MKNNTHTDQIAHSLAEKLREQTMAHNELFQFVKQYAVDRKLLHRALVLQLNYFSAPLENRADIALEIEDLIEKVRLEQHDDEQVLAEKRAARDLRHELSKQRFEQEQQEQQVVVELKNLSKNYSGKRGFRLEPLNLKFYLGEITGIVGANANGKSTLLRMIVGELLKSGGEIDFPFFEKKRGRKLSWDFVKRRISYIPQQIPDWSAGLYTTLQYEAATHGILGKDCDREVDFILERLDLTEDARSKSWHELSGGYKLRFALARALVWQPSLLVLDEPLANLDVSTQMIILNDLRNLAHSFKNPICMLITSQHIHEIENIADRLILLDKGQVRYDGIPGRFGAENEYNCFEFSSPMSTEKIRTLLSPETVLRLDETGFHYLLRTPRTVGVDDLLRELSRADVPLTYFRDISHSVKQIFYETPGNF